MPRSGRESADRIWRPDGLGQVLLVRGPGYAYQGHHSADLVVSLVDTVGVRVIRGRHRYLLRPGDLSVWHPGEEHSADSVNGAPWRYRLMVIELPWLLDTVLEPAGITRVPMFPDPVLRDPHMARRFAQLFRILDSTGPPLESAHGLVGFLRQMIARSPTATRSPRRADDSAGAFRLAREMLAERVTEQVTLEDLAGAVGVSRYAVIRMFQRGAGVSPHAYQIGLRIQRARLLLERGAPASEVGTLVGFYDQSHFYRHFRRACGMTPGRYADSFRR